MRQLRGILLLIPAALILSVLIAALLRPRVEQSLQVAADQKTEVGERRPEVGKEKYTKIIKVEQTSELRTPNSDLRDFDPNVLDADGFVRLGFSPRQAEVIVRYRSRLGGFRTEAQIAECYVISPEMFARIEPYIRIERKQETGERKQETENRRQETGNNSQFSILNSQLELNSADSAALVGISGIGALTAGRILAFRAALGGFARVEQLAEVRGMTRENYERILPQISLDTLAVRKIDINFASPQTLAGHPYFTPEVLRRVVRNRQLKGGWSRTEQLVLDKTLTAEQAERLAPYLTFN